MQSLFFHSNIFIKAKHIHITANKRCMHTHTPTHAYLYKSVCMHTWAIGHIHIYTHAPPHPYIHTHTHIQKHIHPHTYLHIYMKKGNNPIQMMLNKLHQMWSGSKASLCIPPHL